jgi:DNA-directed RNA polymerase subunit M/transcription elongation factor TFIIS
MIWMILALLFVVSVWMLVSGVSGPIRRQKEMEDKYGVQVAHYMATYGLSKRKARKRIEMETVVKEMERRIFTAMVDCPKCGAWAFHWLKGRARIGHVTRQCRECGHEWRQI